MNNILLLLSIVVIISSEFSGLLKKRKEKYHNHISVKLSNIQASAKTYWSILKTFYNGNNIPIYTSIKTNILLTTTITITVCYYHATYEFSSEFTLYSLPDCQGTTCSKQAPEIL